MYMWPLGNHRVAHKVWLMRPRPLKKKRASQPRLLEGPGYTYIDNRHVQIYLSIYVHIHIDILYVVYYVLWAVYIYIYHEMYYVL